MRGHEAASRRSMRSERAAQFQRLPEGPLQAGQVALQIRPDALLRDRLGRKRVRVGEIRSQLPPFHHLGEEEGPGAGHDLTDRVAAAPERDPAPVAQLVRELVEPASDLRPQAGRAAEVGERIEQGGCRSRPA